MTQIRSSLIFYQALVVEDLTAVVAAAALSFRHLHGIDFNDAVLLECMPAARCDRSGHR